jgi:hypothetical protein
MADPVGDARSDQFGEQRRRNVAAGSAFLADRAGARLAAISVQGAAQNVQLYRDNLTDTTGIRAARSPDSEAFALLAYAAALTQRQHRRDDWNNDKEQNDSNSL